MVEAYLFADRDALGIAGVPNDVEPQLVHLTNVEAFEVNDSDPDWKRKCQQNNAKNHAHDKAWWREECHPKHYLEHLIQDVSPDQKTGKEALLALKWTEVTKNNTDSPIISALFADIADWFGMIENPLIGIPSPDFWPSKQVNRDNFLLRNM
jgi:hypothetical protein